MRFLVSVIDSATGTATPGEMAQIDAFNERLQADGRWVVACGISAPSEAVVIDGRVTPAATTAGPLVDSVEYVSGFWIIDVPDAENAASIATEGSKACNRRVELRALLGWRPAHDAATRRKRQGSCRAPAGSDA